MQIRCCNRQDMIYDNMRVGDVVYAVDQQKIYLVVEDGWLEVCNYGEAIARELAKEDGWRPKIDVRPFSQNEVSIMNQSVKEAVTNASIEMARVPDIPPIPEIAR